MWNDPSSDNRDYYCDSSGDAQYEVTGTQDCDASDGWYNYGDYGPGCNQMNDPTAENRDYYVITNTNTCTYATCETNDCDSSDGWYGGGDTPQATCGVTDNDATSYQRDYYANSSGGCNYTTTGCSTKDCDSSDDWYGGGNTSGCGDDPSSYWRDYYVIANSSTCNYTTSCSGTNPVDCDSSDICSLYCEGSTSVEFKDYFVTANSNTCTYSLGSTENCLTKTSIDSDAGNYPLVGGYCEDFTGCSGGNCDSTNYSDYCSANSLNERYASGASCSTYSPKNCDDYDNYFCQGNDRYFKDYYCYDVAYDYCNYIDVFQETCNTGCDEGGDANSTDYLNQGWVLDYTGCSGSNCANEGTQYDYCSGTTVYERYCSGGADYSNPYDCQNYEGTLYCETGSGNIYREEWGCGTGACSDASAADSVTENCSDCQGETTPSYETEDTAVKEKQSCSGGQTSCPSTEYADSCQPGEVIREYYCSGTNAVYSDYDCDSLDACSGACPGCTFNDYSCFDTVNDYCTFSTHDPDESSAYCSGCSLNWNAGGEVDPTACCGDDAGEYYVTSGLNSACCDSPNDAVNESGECVNALDIKDFNVLDANAMNRVFGFTIINRGNSDMNSLHWTLDTGENVIESQENIVLSAGEEIFVYAEHTYSETGTYEVIATVNNGGIAKSRAVYFANEGTGTTLTDATPNNNNGSFKGVGEPAWSTSSKFGSHALEFDGLDDFVSVPDSDSLDLNDSISLSAWVYADSLTSERPILGKYGGGAWEEPTVDQYTSQLYHANTGSGTILIDAAKDYNGSIQSSSMWTTDSRFGAYGLTFNGTSNYVDFGIAFDYDQATLELWIKPSSTAYPAAVWGKDIPEDNAGDSRLYFDANKLRFYLQDANLGAHNIFSEQPIPVNEWTHVAVTWGANGMHMYINGNHQNDTDPYTGGIGGSMQALKFGSNSIGNAEFYSGKMDEIRFSYGVQRTSFGPGKKAYYLGLNQDGTVKFSLGSGSTETTLNSISTVSPLQWTQITAVSNGTTMKIYKNGVMDLNTVTAPVSINNSSEPLLIGENSVDSTFFDGKIDEIKVTSSPRTRYEYTSNSSEVTVT